jgi:hypothetical protein
MARNACYPDSDISKRTVIASFPEGSGTREWLENLHDSQWAITAFVPKKRLVCAVLVSDSGIEVNFTLTIPNTNGKI